MSRANSLKKAVRQIIEMTEKALDEQNAQSGLTKTLPRITLQCPDDPEGEVISKSMAVLVIFWLVCACILLTSEKTHSCEVT